MDALQVLSAPEPGCLLVAHPLQRCIPSRGIPDINMGAVQCQVIFAAESIYREVFACLHAGAFSKGQSCWSSPARQVMAALVFALIRTQDGHWQTTLLATLGRQVVHWVAKLKLFLQHVCTSTDVLHGFGWLGTWKIWRRLLLWLSTSAKSSGRLDCSSPW